MFLTSVLPSPCISQRALLLCTSQSPICGWTYAFVSVAHVRVFLRFRMGIQSLPIYIGRRPRVSRHFRLCDMCRMEAVGYEQDFTFTSHALHFMLKQICQLFASGNRSLRSVLWQEDLCAVLRLVNECFALRFNAWIAFAVALYHQTL
jgi:hypothetical protein